MFFQSSRLFIKRQILKAELFRIVDFLVSLPDGAFYSAKTWVCNYPLCPPASYAPDLCT